MRVLLCALLGSGNAYDLQHLHGPAPGLATRRPPVNAHDFGDLLADGEHGVERRHRFLEDHRNAGTAHGSEVALAEGDEVAPLEEDATFGLDASRWPNESQDRQRRDRFPTPRFADETDRLSRRDREGDAVHGARYAGVAEEERAQVLDLEQRVGHAGCV